MYGDLLLLQFVEKCNVVFTIMAEPFSSSLQAKFHLSKMACTAST
jgi:hypothetical protein